MRIENRSGVSFKPGRENSEVFLFNFLNYICTIVVISAQNRSIKVPRHNTDILTMFYLVRKWMPEEESKTSSESESHSGDTYSVLISEER